MKKRSLTLLFVLVVTVSAIALSGQAADHGELLTLQGDQDIVSLAGDTVIDLNGYNIGTLMIENGAFVTVKDSQTDDYDAENDRGYGTIAAVSGGSVTAAKGYVLIEENGVTSAHKLTLTVSGVSLRATELDTYGASVYYQCTFGGDEVIRDHLDAYGVAMGAGKSPDFRKNSYTTKTDTKNWISGAEFTDNSTLLKGIMKQRNDPSVNERNGSMDIYCQAYVEVNGNRITGPSVCFSLQDIVEGTDTLSGVEQQWSSLESTQKTAAESLYNAFTSVVNNWSIPQIRQYVTGGAYQIWLPKDIYVLNVKTDGDFILMNDLDMTGVDFTPVSVFYGTFDGNDKTISNLTVDPDSGNYVGMFVAIAEEGRVFDLNLRDITVDACGTGARFVGTIAGENYGTINNCTVTGTIIHDREGTETTYVFLGAFVGRCYEGSVTKGGTSLSTVDTLTDVNGKTVTYSTTGLCAKVKMIAPDSLYVVHRLAGNYPGSGTYTLTGDWQDLSFSTEDDSALIQNRRKAAVKAMHDMGTFKWTVPNLNGLSTAPDLIHYGTTDTTKQESHIHTQKFYSGTTYYGIPYDHTSSSYEQAMFYMNEGTNGVYVLNNEASSAGNSTWGGEKDQDAFGNELYKGFTKYIGNDCSGAVAWAWHHASLRYVKSGGVYVLLSSNMIPTDAAETTYGIYRVGFYTVTDEMVDKDGVITTPAIVAANNEIRGDLMYESYARAQMGDGLIYGEPGGHARLLSQDSVVIRNAKGSIYSTKSYVVVHEQGDGLYDRTTTNSSWRINYKYTFYQLLNGKTKSSGKGYLPITLKAFQDDSVKLLYSAPYEYLPSGETQILTPAQGQINAGNRILCATVTVKDSAGKVVYEKTAFKGENGLQNAYRSMYLSMVMKYYFSDYVDYVTSGESYTFSVDCTVAGGTLNEDGTISNTTVNVINNRSFISP